MIGKRIEELGGHVQELIIEEPASIEKIQQVEKDLGYELPISFKKVLNEFSSHFSLLLFLAAFIQITVPDLMRNGCKIENCNLSIKSSSNC